MPANLSLIINLADQASDLLDDIDELIEDARDTESQSWPLADKAESASIKITSLLLRISKEAKKK